MAHPPTLGFSCATDVLHVGPAAVYQTASSFEGTQVAGFNNLCRGKQRFLLSSLHDLRRYKFFREDKMPLVDTVIRPPSTVLVSNCTRGASKAVPCDREDGHLRMLPSGLHITSRALAIDAAWSRLVAVRDNLCTYNEQVNVDIKSNGIVVHEKMSINVSREIFL